jgi:hypothetical protein
MCHKSIAGLICSLCEQRRNRWYNNPMNSQTNPIVNKKTQNSNTATELKEIKLEDDWNMIETFISLIQVWWFFYGSFSFEKEK